jgi:nitrous oxidase accessory protein NosD
VSSTIVVPDDYPTIQEAINHANAGDTVFVRSGTYFENVVVNKRVSLIGEDLSTTIIDGMNKDLTVWVQSSNVSVSGFTIAHGDYYDVAVYGEPHSGMFPGLRGVVIKDNLICNTSWGIGSVALLWCRFEGNVIQSIQHAGLEMQYCRFNTVVGNNISGCQTGVLLLHIDDVDGLPFSSSDNEFYHNNFIENTVQVDASENYGFSDDGPNSWDNGYPSGGNYWSNSNGSDTCYGPYQNLTGPDGVIDVPYSIKETNIDQYPLTELYDMDPPILGDVNKDMKVDMGDLVLLCRAFGSTPGSPTWNHNCDLDYNSRVDMGDIIIGVKNFGQHYP